VVEVITYQWEEWLGILETDIGKIGSIFREKNYIKVPLHTIYEINLNILKHLS
jgi:hypothetical protein